MTEDEKYNYLIQNRFQLDNTILMAKKKLIIDNIKPRIAIPIHYKTIVGSDEDAFNFINKVKEEGIESYKLY